MIYYKIRTNGKLQIDYKQIYNFNYKNLLRAAYFSNYNTNFVYIKSFIKGFKIIHLKDLKINVLF